MSLWIDEPATEHDVTSRDLVELLTSVLQTQIDITAFLEEVDGIDLGDVPWPTPTFKARLFWAQYVLELRAAALLKRVVASTLDRFPPKRAEFTRFLELRVVNTAGWYSVKDPLAAQFVGPGRSHPVFDRKRLRDELALLHHEGFRTLNITGDRSSGKTFSIQLIQLLSEREKFPILHVDVADWGTQPFTAIDLIREFARHLKVDIPITSDDSVPDPHTRARLMVSEVREAFPPGPLRWIVIDGLDRPNVEPDASAFVEKLVKSIDQDGKPANVRLVVTGFGGMVSDDTRHGTIDAIIRDHVSGLFQVLTEQLSKPVDPAKLEEWTDRVWNAFDPAVHDLRDLGLSVYNLVREELGQ